MRKEKVLTTTAMAFLVGGDGAAGCWVLFNCKILLLIRVE